MTKKALTAILVVSGFIGVNLVAGIAMTKSPRPQPQALPSSPPSHFQQPHPMAYDPNGAGNEWAAGGQQRLGRDVFMVQDEDNPERYRVMTAEEYRELRARREQTGNFVRGVLGGTGGMR